MEKSLLEQIEICTKILSQIAIPIILVILGTLFNNSFKEKELRVKYIEIAVSILSNKATAEALPLRNWAINTINHYAETKLTPEAKEIVRVRPLPIAHTIDNVKDIDSIIDLDKTK